MAEFTGERIIPGEVDADLLNEHFARYAFAARLARGKRLLDAGCGTGYGSAELAKSAGRVVGVDQSADALAYAREHYRLPNLRFAQTSVTALPFADASFDLVVAFEVIEHLEDWRAFLVEVRRVLVPTGQFIVSTPNKLFYAESRRLTGPNPFHQHEFEYAEFRNELSEVFPNISLFLENHVEGVVFQPVESGSTAEIRVDGADAAPAESHFFVAVCAHRSQTGAPTFVYVPSAANLLRERERHILLLEGELKQKNEWLEKAQFELVKLNEDHQKVLAMFREQKDVLEQRNRWAEELNRKLEEAGRRIVGLQEEVVGEQARSREVAAQYENKVAELEGESRAKTEWARRLDRELEDKTQELARAVDYLHEAEKTVEERTRWAQQLQAEVDQLKGIVAMYQASRWVKMGRTVGLGPKLS